MTPGFLLGAFLVFAGAHPVVAEESALAEGLSDWALSAPRATYGEIVSRFLRAAGRDPAPYETEMASLESRFRKFLAAGVEEPRARVEALQRFIFEECGFSADLNLADPDNLYPDSILRRRRGYCLGLSVLLADLGERLGWPLAVVGAPRHIFVRYRGESTFNLETTLRGTIHGDDWYRERYGVEEELTDLDRREIVAHFANNHGFVLLAKGALDEAERDFRAALKLQPELVEARINLGVLSARRGRLESAIAHFREAERRWPRDAQIQLNLINALVGDGRTGPATERMLDLLERAPRFSGIDRSFELLQQTLLRSASGDAEEWQRVQRLVTKRNEKVAERERVRPGLRGTYYGDPRLEQARWSRIDRDINFSWSWNSPGKGLPRDRFSARWEGLLQAGSADVYTFYVTCSDGVRIWVDGRLVVDSWGRANDNFTRGAVDLIAGLHDFRVEYFESIGEAGITILLTADKKKKALDLADGIFHVARPDGG